MLVTRAVAAVGMLTIALTLSAGIASAAQSGVPVQLPRTSASAAATDIRNTTWLWVRSDYSDDTSVEAADPNRYTLTLLDDGRVTIQADCNSVTGSYQLVGSRINIQLGPSTLVACGPDSQDRVFLNDLNRAVTYVMDGDQLVLDLRVDSGTMHFAPAPTNSLTDGPWLVTGINNGRQAVMSVVQGTRVTATFDDAGRVSGNTGCNNYGAAYALDGTSIAFGPVVSTRRACLSDAASAQEQAFLAALGASTTVDLTGDRLTLRDDSGATQLTMVRPSR